MMIDSLAICGSGIKVGGIMGALQCMKDLDKIKTDDLKYVSGVSSGSILASILSFKPKDLTLMKQYITTFSLAKAFDLNFNNTIENLVHNFGLDDGETFISHVIDLFISYEIDPDITFLQAHNSYNNTLIIGATNMDIMENFYFSYQNYPDMKIIDAIRASTAIQGIFCPVLINDIRFGDGGLVDNFGYDHLKSFIQEDGYTTNNLFGIIFDNMQYKKIESIMDVVGNVFSSLTASPPPKDPEKTLVIKGANYSILSDLTLEEQKALYESGYDQCNDFFST